MCVSMNPQASFRGKFYNHETLLRTSRSDVFSVRPWRYAYLVECCTIDWVPPIELTPDLKAEKDDNSDPVGPAPSEAWRGLEEVLDSEDDLFSANLITVVLLNEHKVKLKD